MQFKDQLHREIQLNSTPKRIVSLVPSQTELLCHLGLEEAIVGITKFCVHPKNLIKDKTIVGGTKQIHVEKIEELQPDIILCNKEENTKEIVSALTEMAPVHISDINSIKDCIELITMYGELFEVGNEATDLIVNVKSKQSDFESFVSKNQQLKIAYFIWKEPWMVVGSDTFINYMLKISRFTNYFQEHSRYPEISLEREYSDVDYVFLSSEPYPFKEAHFKQIQPCFPNAKITIVDGEMFSWYGSRLLQSFEYFKKLHKELFNN